METNVRVRFAPSPTGPLHIGGVRTALYNYLFAKKHGGDFILRIEDTDQARFIEGAEAYIIEALEWLSITPDEAPGIQGKYGFYRQSERNAIYPAYAQQLLNSGNAYYAFDTAEDLTKIRDDHEKEGKVFSYDAHTRSKLVNSLTLSSEELQARLTRGDAYVIRFKVPEQEEIFLYDEIRGDITVQSHTLDDKILFKSDGFPTYHLANIVDDHLMEITHVIRGEEWLPSLPLHHLLYRALGWVPPKFAHLPLLLKPEGKGKLSKRDGDKLGFPVFPLTWVDPQTKETSRGYREEGYFPEAVVNMLALLGWNPGTEQERFTLPELIGQFDLTRVSKSGARFSKEKAVWFNQQYLQEKPSTYWLPYFTQGEKTKTYDTPILLRIIDLMKERAAFPQELVAQSDFFFCAPTQYNSGVLSKALKTTTVEHMQALLKALEETTNFTAEAVREAIKGWMDETSIGFGAIMQPLRLALVGDLKGPDLFEVMEILGEEEVKLRIINLINHQNNKS